jgi:hypothetical protein
MSRLYLRCAICGRQQAEGLISGAGWGRLELPSDVRVDHPALNGSTLRACPSCVSGNPNWQNGLLTSLGLASGFEPRPATH